MHVDLEINFLEIDVNIKKICYQEKRRVKNIISFSLAKSSS